MKLYIFAGNNPAFTLEALECVKPIWGRVVVINNTDQPIPAGDYAVYTPLAPYTFSQSQNLAQRLARQDGADFFMTAHDDARFPPHVITEFEAKALKAFADDPKAGLVFAHYDVLMAYRMAAVNAVGEWDVWLPQYGSDVDYFWRFEVSGWKKLSIPFPEIRHEASHKIKHNAQFRDRTYLFDAWKDTYLRRKWGLNQKGQPVNKQPGI